MSAPSASQKAAPGSRRRGGLFLGIGAGFLLLLVVSLGLGFLVRLSQQRASLAVATSPASPPIRAAATVAAMTPPVQGLSLPAPTEAGSVAKEAVVLAPVPPTKPGPVVASRGRIAILLTDIGAQDAVSRQAIAALPGAISLGFDPNGQAGIAALAKAAQADGHEIWLGVPMEPRRYPALSPGRDTLLLANSLDENLTRLQRHLGRLPHYVGVFNITGSAFTADAEALRPVMRLLSGRNLRYVDARASRDTVGPQLARSFSLPTALNDRFIDADPTAPAIKQQLAALEAVAAHKGQAIGFAQAQPQTIAQLAAWAPALALRGYTLVPLTLLTD